MPVVVESVIRTAKVENISLSSRPLFSVTGEISVDGKTISTRRILLDCGVTTIYVVERLVNGHQLETKKFEDKNIGVKLGDNQIVEMELEVVKISGLGEFDKCVGVVHATTDEFDYILRIPFIEDIQPHIDCKIDQSKDQDRRFPEPDSRRGTARETNQDQQQARLLRSPEERSIPTDGYTRGSLRSCDFAEPLRHTVILARGAVQKVRRTVVRKQQQDSSAGKGSVWNSDSESSKREGTAGSDVDGGSTQGKNNIVGKMSTMGGGDEIVHHKKEAKKFLEIKTKSIEEPVFMLVLFNETTKRVARTLQRQDQLDSVLTAKAQRYFETDWESFQDNPAFNLLMEYKDNVFRLELPEGSPEIREIEHRIDVKDPNLEMYKQQWLQ
ncbi:Hypothetical protein PHPALM_19738 [Phytophthora palmivora]|uniref:Uncharacterized protein n=1 Tax=Phytophthora palmivora TaxID=4796 RepID=A0A2P4XGL9_9STRA|nr:Hypothetical protein PHPALM_19738 [Phytophthora palmivora]